MSTVIEVTFDNILNFDTERAVRIWGSDFVKDKPISYGMYANRFEKLFAPLVEEDNYYLFIVSAGQWDEWEKHCEKFDLSKYIVYKNPVPVRNANYGPEERLRLFILKFDSAFVKKWSNKQ